MRQYLRKHLEYIVIAVVLLCAMIFQYFRIANIDIAFLIETSISNVLVYAVAILLIPLLVLFFVFIPLLFIFEVSVRIHLPQINIEVTKVVYSIKPVITNTSFRLQLNTVLRC